MANMQGAPTSGQQEEQKTALEQYGINLTEIAKKHGVTINDIKRWNSLKSTRIRPGQKLKISA